MTLVFTRADEGGVTCGRIAAAGGVVLYQSDRSEVQM